MVTVADRAKLATAAASAVMAGTVHGLVVPVHAPDQPVKMLPDAAVAVRMAWPPSATGSVQVAPQFMPADTLTTVPLPAPDLVRLRLCSVAATELVSPAVLLAVLLSVTAAGVPMLKTVDAEVGPVTVAPNVIESASMNLNQAA